MTLHIVLKTCWICWEILFSKPLVPIISHLLTAPSLSHLECAVAGPKRLHQRNGDGGGGDWKPSCRLIPVIQVVSNNFPWACIIQFGSFWHEVFLGIKLGINLEPLNQQGQPTDLIVNDYGKLLSLWLPDQHGPTIPPGLPGQPSLLSRPLLKVAWGGNKPVVLANSTVSKSFNCTTLRYVANQKELWLCHNTPVDDFSLGLIVLQDQTSRSVQFQWSIRVTQGSIHTPGHGLWRQRWCLGLRRVWVFQIQDTALQTHSCARYIVISSILHFQINVSTYMPLWRWRLRRTSNLKQTAYTDYRYLSCMVVPCSAVFPALTEAGKP